MKDLSDKRQYLRVHLRDGRVVEGWERRFSSPPKRSVLILNVVRVLDSSGREVDPTPLDSFLVQPEIRRIEVLHDEAAEPSSFPGAPPVPRPTAPEQDPVAHEVAGDHATEPDGGPLLVPEPPTEEPSPVPSPAHATAQTGSSRALEPLVAPRPSLRVAPVPAVAATALSKAMLVVLAVAIAASGATLRLWKINALGFNSDEAVYSGQAAAIASDPVLKEFFPIFRAHPLLNQFTVALVYQLGVTDFSARLVGVAFGLAAIYVAYLLGRLLYGRRAGFLAALFIAVMPYAVIVSRQALLDVPLALFASLTFYLLARYAATNDPRWLYATGAGLGLTFLSKETGIILLPAVYAFLALSPSLRIRMRDVALSFACFLAASISFPLSLIFGGGTGTAHSFLVWQLFRPANHPWTFYPGVFPRMVGPLLLIAAVAGLVLLRRHHSWRETLLLSWIAVPLLFFELWPVKGFQYLLPLATPTAVLAARALDQGLARTSVQVGRRRVSGALIALFATLSITASLVGESWLHINSLNATEFLAGSGGVPAGRAAGNWVHDNVPAGAEMLTIGPSMGNILQFYGHRRTFGLSVSPNPLHRNPTYDPVSNPDLLLRTGELQYIVWDTYSAVRSTFFAQKLLRYARRYHGRVVHIESVRVPTPDGSTRSTPAIVIYQVRP